MAMYRLKSGSESWFALRSKYITATEMASLFGLNSYMSAKKLYENKQNKNNAVNNKYTRNGKILEPSVIMALELDLGLPISPPCERGYCMVFTDEENRISSTPDAFYWDESRPAVVEAKSTQLLHFTKNWSGDCPPLRYIMQVHAQMLTTGLKRGYLACVVAMDNIPLSVYEVTSSHLIDQHMKMRVLEYWNAATIGKTLTTTAAMREEMASLAKDSCSFMGIFKFPEQIESQEFTLEDLFK